MLLYLCRDQSLIKLIKPWTKPKTSGNVLTLLLSGSLLSLSNKYHELVLSSKTQYYSSFVSSVSHSPKCLWQTVNKLLHGKSSSPLPTTSGTTCRQACFFFSQAKYQNSVFHQQPCYIVFPFTFCPPDFSVFTPASESEILKIHTLV